MTIKLTDISPVECYRMLEGARYGHLSCCRNGQPYIASVYFAFEGSIAYSFTMPGKKLDWMRENNRVCLHVEEKFAEGEWTSVVIDGSFEEFPYSESPDSQRFHAWSLLQKHSDWWEIGASKPYKLPLVRQSPHVFYGVHVETVSGRRAVRLD